jgi:ornithine carbamoyltransferase
MATPASHRLDQATVEKVASLGGNLVQTAAPDDAVKEADAVYSDVWVSMGREAESMERLESFAPYQVGTSLMSRAAPGAAFLLCLPAHRGQEVAAQVIDGRASSGWPHAANRLRAMRGLLLWMFT